MGESYTSVECNILQSTGKALLISMAGPNDDPIQFWVPKSVCSEGSAKLDELDSGDEVELRIADWFLNKQFEE